MSAASLLVVVVLFVAHGARVTGIGPAPEAAGVLFVAHGARVTGIGPLFAEVAAETRKFSVGAVRSICEGVQVAGKSLEKTKCWTTCRLSSTSP